MKTVRTSHAASRFFWVQLSGVTMVILALGVLSSCDKSDYNKNGNLEGRASIIPMANVHLISDTKSAVVGTTFPENTTKVFGVTAFSHATTAPSTDWSAAPYFDNVAVNSGAASALTFNTNQYYPANGDKVYFYAYAPTVSSLTAGTSFAAPIAAYTITGQEDIMAAQVVTGIATATIGTQSQPAFAFTHKLMQLRFKVVADASFETGKTVTEVLIKNVKTSAKLSIDNGSLTFDDAAADKTLSLPITAGTKDEITTAGTEMNNSVMCAPVGAAGEVILKITADGVVYDNVVVILTGTNSGEAGTSHLITLTFKREKIISTATITDWKSSIDKDADIGGDGWLEKPTIGNYRDGGIIYEATDATNYKVFSLTEGAGSFMWSAHYKYVLGPIEQSDTNGKKNVAAMKAYSENNTTNSDVDKKTTGVFRTDFPAAWFCDAMNTGGVTGWYLPAVEELIAFSEAYNANSTVLDAAITANGGTAMSVSELFWSSTEDHNKEPVNAYTVSLQSNLSSPQSKNFYLAGRVRCIKDI